MNRRNRKGVSSSWREWRKIFPARGGNWKVVGLCVIAATTFWFFSALNKSDYTTQINYPITFSYPDDSTYLLSQLPEDIRVQVNGGGWDLLRKTLLFNVPPVEIKLDEPTKVKYITGRSLTEEVEATLGDVRLDYILTDTLRLAIDSAQAKEVTVALDSTTVSLEENHWFTSPVSLTPRSARLIGPASVVAQAPDTLWVSLPEGEIDEDYDATISLDYVNPMVAIAPSEANVQFSVANFVPFSRSVPITLVNFPDDSSAYLAQQKVSVNFWVKEPLAEDLSMDSVSFRVVANHDALRSDSTLRLSVVRQPDFAERVSVAPSRLRVRYAR